MVADEETGCATWIDAMEDDPAAPTLTFSFDPDSGCYSLTQRSCGRLGSCSWPRPTIRAGRGADAHLPETDNMVHMQDAEATITARIICALPWDISGSELTVPVKLTKAEENDSGADSNQVPVKLLSTANLPRKEDVCVVSSFDSVWLIGGSVSSGRVCSDLLPLIVPFFSMMVGGGERWCAGYHCLKPVVGHGAEVLNYKADYAPRCLQNLMDLSGADPGFSKNYLMTGSSRG